MDAGAIWSTKNFKFDMKRKSSLYCDEVTEYGSQALMEATKKFFHSDFIPETLDYNNPTVLGKLMPAFKRAQREVNWEKDTTHDIVLKILASDGRPGAVGKLFGKSYHLFGCRIAPDIKPEARPGEVLSWSPAKIIIKTIDGAISLTHLQEKKEDNPAALKLLSSKVLCSSLSSVPPDLSGSSDVSFKMDGKIGYLKFDFLNGALGVDECHRLLHCL